MTLHRQVFVCSHSIQEIFVESDLGLLAAEVREVCVVLGRPEHQATTCVCTCVRSCPV